MYTKSQKGRQGGLANLAAFIPGEHEHACNNRTHTLRLHAITTVPTQFRWRGQISTGKPGRGQAGRGAPAAAAAAESCAAGVARPEPCRHTTPMDCNILLKVTHTTTPAFLEQLKQHDEQQHSTADAAGLSRGSYAYYRVQAAVPSCQTVNWAKCTQGIQQLHCRGQQPMRRKRAQLPPLQQQQQLFPVSMHPSRHTQNHSPSLAGVMHSPCSG
jgi:hypothetical protein